MIVPFARWWRYRAYHSDNRKVHTADAQSDGKEDDGGKASTEQDGEETEQGEEADESQCATTLAM